LVAPKHIVAISLVSRGVGCAERNEELKFGEGSVHDYIICRPLPRYKDIPVAGTRSSCCWTVLKLAITKVSF